MTHNKTFAIHLCTYSITPYVLFRILCAKLILLHPQIIQNSKVEVEELLVNRCRDQQLNHGDRA